MLVKSIVKKLRNAFGSENVIEDVKPTYDGYYGKRFDISSGSVKRKLTLKFHDARSLHLVHQKNDENLFFALDFDYFSSKQNRKFYRSLSSIKDERLGKIVDEVIEVFSVDFASMTKSHKNYESKCFELARKFGLEFDPCANEITGNLDSKEIEISTEPNYRSITIDHVKLITLEKILSVLQSKTTVTEN